MSIKRLILLHFTLNLKVEVIEILQKLSGKF